MNFLEFYALAFGPFMAFCGAAWIWETIWKKVSGE